MNEISLFSLRETLEREGSKVCWANSARRLSSENELSTEDVPLKISNSIKKKKISALQLYYHRIY